MFRKKKTKVSLIIRNLIIFCTSIMMGYLRIFPFVLAGDIKIHLAMIMIGVIMTFIIIIYGRKTCNVFKNRTLKVYLTGYILILIYSSIFTFVYYDYSFREIVIALDPFMYIIFAGPLVYGFYHDKGYRALFKRIIILEIVMLIIKSISWWAYNYKNISILHRILFQYGIWMRDGFQRIDTGLFFGITTVLLVYQYFKGEIKHRWLSLILLAFMFAYLVLVTRARYETIIFIVTIAVEIYTLLKPRSKILYWLFVLVILFVAMVGGYFSELLFSFSIDNSNYGKSTVSRILTVEHYWQYICERKALFGLGLLNNNNIQAYELMERPDSTAIFYHLTDIGILGGFVRFGLLAIWIYGFFYYHLIKICFEYKKRGYEEAAVLTGIAVWVVFWGASNNLLDSSRAFEFPFYLAIVSYYSWRMKETKK